MPPIEAKNLPDWLAQFASCCRFYGIRGQDDVIVQCRACVRQWTFPSKIYDKSYAIAVMEMAAHALNHAANAEFPWLEVTDTGQDE